MKDMAKLAYCPTCRKKVRFETDDDTAATELDGVLYEYPIKVAVCSTCGDEAVFPPYQDEASLAFGDAVRAAQGVVTLDDIRLLPRKYHIGKRPLSRLLGWGEHTYSRFMEGAVPSRKYSETIKNMIESPESFLALLRGNRDRITADAFKKSEAAVLSVMRNEYPDKVRLYEVAEVLFAFAKGDITNMALQKLVYYVQGFGLGFLGRSIIPQMPKAWAFGPVYGQLWHEYNEIQALFMDAPADSSFTEEEERLLSAVYDAFGMYSGQCLSGFTHIEDPWVNARARAGVGENERCEEVITKEDMETFFCGLINEYNLESFADIKKYPEALMQRRNFARQP